MLIASLRSLREEQIVNLEKHCVTILNVERLMSLVQSPKIVASISGTVRARYMQPSCSAMKLTMLPFQMGIFLLKTIRVCSVRNFNPGLHSFGSRGRLAASENFFHILTGDLDARW